MKDRTRKDELDYSQLDPGIRETVRRLRYWGFDTTDSGDGHSKADAGYDPDGFCPHPHVYIRSSASQMVTDCKILLRFCRVAGVDIGEIRSADSPSIQAMYDPVDDTAMIMLAGVSDKDWSS